MTEARLSEAGRQAAERCIHCGYCLPACPTYRLTGLETQSPRGRIQLLLAAQEGELALASVAEETLDACLGCRACERACPVRVPYGLILEAAREALLTSSPPFWRRFIRWALRRLLPSRQILAILLVLGRSGAWLAPSRLRPFLKALPWPRQPRWSRGRPRAAPRPVVYLFRGCVQDAGFATTHEATQALLEAAGYEVRIPPRQTCCGALHLHFGDRAFALRLAAQNIAAFPSDGILVSNAGGCGAALKEYGLWFAGEELEAAAHAFASRVRDVSEALLMAPRRLPMRPADPRTVVAYQPSCHLRFVQRLESEPRTLLEATGARVVDLGQGYGCCGSAGIYNLLQPEQSVRLLAAKRAELAASGATIVVTANPGCALQMRAASQGLPKPLPVVQLPEYLLMHLDRRAVEGEA